MSRDVEIDLTLYLTSNRIIRLTDKIQVSRQCILSGRLSICLRLHLSNEWTDSNTIFLTLKRV